MKVECGYFADLPPKLVAMATPFER